MRKKIQNSLKLKPVRNRDFLNNSKALTDLGNLSIGMAFKEIREERNISQGKLASIAHLDQSHICNLEKGRHSPRSSTIYSLCRGLDYKSEDLMKKSSIHYDFIIENASKFICEDEHGNYHINN